MWDGLPIYGLQEMGNMMINHQHLRQPQLLGFVLKPWGLTDQLKQGYDTFIT
jgi:hypothetical protein